EVRPAVAAFEEEAAVLNLDLAVFDFPAVERFAVEEADELLLGFGSVLGKKYARQQQDRGNQGSRFHGVGLRGIEHSGGSRRLVNISILGIHANATSPSTLRD